MYRYVPKLREYLTFNTLRRRWYDSLASFFQFHSKSNHSIFSFINHSQQNRLNHSQRGLDSKGMFTVSGFKYREEGLYRIYQLLRERNIKHCYSLSSMLGFLDLLHFVKPGNNMVCQCLPPKRNIIIKMKSGTLRATPHNQEISGNEVALSLFMIFPC